jgi:hypothetical protein
MVVSSIVESKGWGVVGAMVWACVCCRARKCRCIIVAWSRFPCRVVHVTRPTIPCSCHVTSIEISKLPDDRICDGPQVVRFTETV